MRSPSPQQRGVSGIPRNQNGPFKLAPDAVERFTAGLDFLQAPRPETDPVRPREGRNLVRLEAHQARSYHIGGERIRAGDDSLHRNLDSVGRTVSLHRRRAVNHYQPELVGPHHVYDGRGCGGGLDFGRHIVHVAPHRPAEGAARLMEAVTRDFNRFQVPFQFKCGTRAAHYPRRDAAVLYLHGRYYAIAVLLVERVHLELRAWLNAGTPLFARRLADGLGFAEDPGDSFGKHRCKILAAAMAVTRGKPAEERLQEVRRQFERRGLSLDQPWLNPGSVGRYEFPFPAV